MIHVAQNQIHVALLYVQNQIHVANHAVSQIHVANQIHVVHLHSLLFLMIHVVMENQNITLLMNNQ